MAELAFHGVWKRYPDGFEAIAEGDIDDVPGAGDNVVARLNAASSAAPGAPLEPALDATALHLFDPETGCSLRSRRWCSR